MENIEELKFQAKELLHASALDAEMESQMELDINMAVIEEDVNAIIVFLIDNQNKI